jgi:small subunit ribosomal protein S17
MADQSGKRNSRRTLIGSVVGDKTDKTRRVEIMRLSKHPKYGKYLRRRTVCYVHDEKNESSEGDRVVIMETRPLSKTKRWRLVRIVTAASEAAAPKPAEAEAQPTGEAAQPA